MNKGANKGVYVSYYSSECKGANTANSWAVIPGATEPKLEAATQTSEASVSQSYTGKISFSSQLLLYHKILV